MNKPEYTQTIVGMPCPSDPTDHESFPLSTLKSTGIRPRSDLPRDMRGMTGSIPVYIPPARRVRTQRPEPAPTLALPIEHIAAAFIVTALVGLFLWFVR